MVDRTQLQVDRQVFGTDGQLIGQIKEVGDTAFLVARMRQRDVYVPVEAVADVAAGRIVLNLPADQVNAMGWPSPPLTGLGGSGAPPTGYTITGALPSERDLGHQSSR